VSINLLPGVFFDPSSAAAAAAAVLSAAGQQQQQQQEVMRLWSFPPDAMLPLPSEPVAAAVNTLVGMLQCQQQLCDAYTQLHTLQQQHQHQQQQQLQGFVSSSRAAAATAAAGHGGTGSLLLEPAAAAAADTTAAAVAAAGGLDSDGSEGWWSELDGEGNAADDVQDLNPLPDHPHQQQQQQQQQQLQDQLDLLCCPETAAAAAADVRTSLFDFVDSSPWQLEAHDPPGLACTLYR
jgi:hypothetical protein